MKLKTPKSRDALLDGEPTRSLAKSQTGDTRYHSALMVMPHKANIHLRAHVHVIDRIEGATRQLAAALAVMRHNVE